MGLRPTQKAVVTGFEEFGKVVGQAVAGDEVGLVLPGLGREDVERGQVVALAGSPWPELPARVDSRNGVSHCQA